MYQIVLGSTSIYRKAILEKLQVPFETAKPNIDETPLAGESPEALVARLAEIKAKAVNAGTERLVIGSDQVAVLDGEILGKPGSKDKAIEQLLSSSGKKVSFLTGLCLLNTTTGNCQTEVDVFNVHFRRLSKAVIESYIEKESPLDCAGSFKSEGLGIALFSKLEGNDPNSLIGLPLIRLVAMLEKEGYQILG